MNKDADSRDDLELEYAAGHFLHEMAENLTYYDGGHLLTVDATPEKLEELSETLARLAEHRKSAI